MKTRQIVCAIAAIAAIGGTAYAQDTQNHSDRTMRAGEVMTPSGTGNETGGYFFARSAREGESVIAQLYNPGSPNEACPSCREYYAASPAAPNAAAQAPAALADRR